MIKEYLSEYRRARADLEYCRLDLEAAYHAIAGLKAIQVDDMPRTRDAERDLSAAFAAYEETAKRLRERAAADLETMRDVESVIRSAPSLLQYQILRLRYIDGMKWDDIAERIGKTRQWVNTVHGRALVNVEKAREKRGGKHGRLEKIPRD